MILAILQSRLGSQRLPNKALLQIPPGSGVCMLELCIRKAMLSVLIDEVVVVTPDKKIENLCKFWGVRAFLKNFEGRDVLREFYEAARAMKAETIVRITADAPMISPDTIDDCIKEYMRNPCYIAYNTDETIGQLEGEGSDTEIFAYDALRDAYLHAKKPFDREHVTPYIRRKFDSLFVKTRQKGIRSVNTIEDYVWVCENIKYWEITKKHLTTPASGI